MFILKIQNQKLTQNNPLRGIIKDNISIIQCGKINVNCKYHPRFILKYHGGIFDPIINTKLTYHKV